MTILLDDENRVEQARLHIVEFRGFERFIQGRPYWETPVTVQRLCGICPVSHHLAAAIKPWIGSSEVKTSRPRLKKCAGLCIMDSFFNPMHFIFSISASPDLLFGFGADVSKRHVFAVAAKYPELATMGVMLSEVRPGSHQGHCRQKDSWYRSNSRRDQQKPVYRRAGCVSERYRTDCRMVQRSS